MGEEGEPVSTAPAVENTNNQEAEPHSAGDVIPVFNAAVAALNGASGPIADAINVALDHQTTAILLDKAADVRAHWQEIKSVHARVEKYIKIKQVRRDTFWQYINAYNDEKSQHPRESVASDSLEISHYENQYNPDTLPRKNGINRADGTKLLHYFEINGASALEKLARNNEDKEEITRGKLKGMRVEVIQAAVEYNRSLQLQVLKEVQQLPPDPEPAAPPAEPVAVLRTPEPVIEDDDDEETPVALAPIPKDAHGLALRIKGIRSRINYLGHMALVSVALAGAMVTLQSSGSAEQQALLNLNNNTRSAAAPLPDYSGRDDEYNRWTHSQKQMEKAALKPAPVRAVMGEKVAKAEESNLVYQASAAELQAWKIVDHEHPLSMDFVAQTVDITADGIPSNKGELHASPDVVPDLQQLFKDARAAGHKDLVVSSGERDIAYQQNLYEHDKSGFTAVPGESQHHTGYALDFSSSEIDYRVDNQAGFENIDAGKFLAQHAHEYGFIQSYDYESWHFLWVGKPLAKLYHQMKTNGWEGDVFALQRYIDQNQKPFSIDKQGNLIPNKNLKDGRALLAYYNQGQNHLAQSSSTPNS